MNTDRFKFRVWYNSRFDNKGWRMAEVYSFHINKNKVIIANPPFGNTSIDLDHNAILEQSIGLRDKNGKLIFEGDVVKQTYKDGTNLCTEVFYNTELCRWYLRKPYPNLHAVEYMVWDFRGSMADSLEVIGNIHEDQFRDLTKKETGD